MAAHGKMANFKENELPAQDVVFDLFERGLFWHDAETGKLKTKYDFGHCATKTNGKGPLYKDDVVAALLRSSHNLGVAARLLGRSRRALVVYMESNRDVEEFHEDSFESLLDVIEHNVLAKAAAGDSADGRFVLTTRGKNRGYTTRSEHTGRDGGPIQTEQVSEDAERFTRSIASIAARKREGEGA